jgi:hypothetical protein
MSDQTYSNPNATSVDAKETPNISTTTSSPGEYINPNKLLTDVAAANKAEKDFQAYISSTNFDYNTYNKIRLVSSTITPTTSSSNAGQEEIVFDISPTVDEAKNALYSEIGDIRTAASILIYIGSPSRKWSINAQFVSRTKEEATKTWSSVQLLRSWLNPDPNYKYGFDSATPHVLKLYGYGRTWRGIPVVLTSLNVSYPNDIDYVPTSVDNTKVPIVQTVTLNLTEARTVDDLINNKFNLELFKIGQLPNW